MYIKPYNLMRIKGLMCIMEHNLMCINDFEIANTHYGTQPNAHKEFWNS